MDGSATPVQDKSAESSVPGNGTPAASSSSIAVNTGTTQVRAGGAPARVFMNEKIVPYLLEGMKNVTRDQYVANTGFDGPILDTSATLSN